MITKKKIYKKSKSKSISKSIPKSKSKTIKSISKSPKSPKSLKSPNLYIGCHSSIANGILDSIKYVESIGGNALQIFMGSKLQSSIKYKHKFKDQNEIDEIKTYVSNNKICLIIHAIYTINLCKFPSSSGRIKYAHQNILYDLKYGYMIGAKCVVLHLGSKNKDLTIEVALNNLVSNLNYIIKHMPKGIMLSLETSAGRGSEVGWNLEELAIIWNKIKEHNTVGICIDTAHIFVSGYNISTIKGIKDYLEKFDSLIGIKHITNFHINDSRYALGAKNDEHRGIGSGQIYNSKEGIKALQYIKNICIKNKLPMILETHSTGSSTSEGSHKGAHGYEYEIDLIKKL